MYIYAHFVVKYVFEMKGNYGVSKGVKQANNWSSAAI